MVNGIKTLYALHVLLGVKPALIIKIVLNVGLLIFSLIRMFAFANLDL
jgi:hypothetical protein